MSVFIKLDFLLKDVNILPKDFCSSLFAAQLRVLYDSARVIEASADPKDLITEM